MHMDEARAFLANEPMIETVDLLISDLNGILRAKRLPVSSLDKAFTEGMRFPVSVLGMDIFGEDVLDNGLVWETGDGDGVCLPISGAMAVVPWAESPRAQMLTTMTYRDGRVFMGDGRQVLAAQVARLAAMGYTPVVATELEFYLMDGVAATHGRAQPPNHPKSGQPITLARVYGAEVLDEFEAVLSDISETALVQNIPVDTLLTENGPGQFEINFKHVADPLIAADHAVLFKRAVHAVAKRHGMHASFMAKPYGERAGSGLHVHMSLLDRAGRNVFDDGSSEGSGLLKSAVAGLLATLPEAMLIFAPHMNSYRRFNAAAHNPNTASWGYENRSVAVRIPEAGGMARRLEHRVAGADANPYLVMAALLAGVAHGIEHTLTPPPSVTGEAGKGGEATAGLALPLEWGVAIAACEGGAILKTAFGSEFHRAFTALKRQERDIMARRVSDVEYGAYLAHL